MTGPARVRGRRERTRNILAWAGVVLLASTIVLLLFPRAWPFQACCFAAGMACFWSARVMGWRWVR